MYIDLLIRVDEPTGWPTFFEFSIRLLNQCTLLIISNRGNKKRKRRTTNKSLRRAEVSIYKKVIKIGHNLAT